MELKDNVLPSYYAFMKKNGAALKVLTSPEFEKHAVSKWGEGVFLELKKEGDGGMFAGYKVRIKRRNGDSIISVLSLTGKMLNIIGKASRDPCNVPLLLARTPASYIGRTLAPNRKRISEIRKNHENLPSALMGKWPNGNGVLNLINKCLDPVTLMPLPNLVASQLESLVNDGILTGKNEMGFNASKMRDPKVSFEIYSGIVHRFHELMEFFLHRD